MEYTVKQVNDEETLIDLFYFFSRTLCYEDKENNQIYNIMTERYNEMRKQFEEDNEFLLYIEYIKMKLLVELL